MPDLEVVRTVNAVPAPVNGNDAGELTDVRREDRPIGPKPFFRPEEGAPHSKPTTIMALMIRAGTLPKATQSHPTNGKT